MNFTRARAAAVTVGVAGGIAVLAPGSPALAFISPPLVLLGEAQSPAHLVAAGAAVDVTMEYSCTADRMYVDLQITEKVGKKIASGTGSTSVLCDGGTHNTVIRVAASPSGVAFAKGTAVANTVVYGCRERNGRGMCGQDLISRTIAVKK